MYNVKNFTQSCGCYYSDQELTTLINMCNLMKMKPRITAKERPCDVLLISVNCDGIKNSNLIIRCSTSVPNSNPLPFYSEAWLKLPSCINKHVHYCQHHTLHFGEAYLQKEIHGKESKFMVCILQQSYTFLLFYPPHREAKFPPRCLLGGLLYYIKCPSHPGVVNLIE